MSETAELFGQEVVVYAPTRVGDASVSLLLERNKELFLQVGQLMTERNELQEQLVVARYDAGVGRALLKELDSVRMTVWGTFPHLMDLYTDLRNEGFSIGDAFEAAWMTAGPGAEVRP